MLYEKREGEKRERRERERETKKKTDGQMRNFSLVKLANYN